MVEREELKWIEDVVGKTIGFLKTEVSELQERQLTAYLRLLVKWNEKINLISRKSGEAVVADRLFDALLLWREFCPWSLKTHLDIGSGGGFPAMPIHIMAPDTKMWLAEPRARRVSFLVSVMAELGLKGVEVKRCRVGDDDCELGDRANFDIVTAQAVGRPGKVFELASGRLAVNGLYVWVSAEEIKEGQKGMFRIAGRRHERPDGHTCWVGDMKRIE